jgi:hypothetical protein
MASGLKILAELTPPGGGDLPPEVARYVLELDFPRWAHEQYQALSDKAQDGALSPEERAELEEYLAADAVLSAIQSKARRSLKKHSPAA